MERRHGTKKGSIRFADLLLVCIWCIVTGIWIFLFPTTFPIVRAALGIPLTIFLPGYAIVSAIFPSRRMFDGLERVVLSLCLSIAAVSLIAFILNFTPSGIILNTLLLSLVGLILGTVIIAAIRRQELPDEDYYHIPLTTRVANVVAPGRERNSRILLVTVVIVCIISVSLFISLPRKEEHYTEFYILNSEGRLADYPSEFYVFEPQTNILGVYNHEYQRIQYIIEVWMLNETLNNQSNSFHVSAATLLDRLILEIPHNTTQEIQYNWAAPSPDYNKVEFLLFKGAVLETNRFDISRIMKSDRNLYLWVKVLPKPLRE